MQPTSHRTIVFSHANSFPASTYGVLFQYWRSAGYEVHAVEKFGHDPQYPITPGWPHLARQLSDFIERLGDRPVYLVGHSLGGYLSMMVASRHPRLVQGVVALDSPLLFGWKRAGLGLIKLLGSANRVVGASRVSARRTQEWPSLKAVEEHFAGKRKFVAFDPRVLGDYVEQGTEPHHDGRARCLSFRREIETAIYDTFPHHLLGELRRRPICCPVAYIGGTRSKEGRSIGLQAICRVAEQRLSWIDGSHLYPLEHPETTVAEVLKWLSHFEASARSSPTAMRSGA